MAHAIITLAVDLDRAGDADPLRAAVVLAIDTTRGGGLAILEGRGCRVTESSVAVDERLGHEDVDV